MTELSPAAQAVLDALIFLPFSDKTATMEGCAAQQAAAVLVAAVDQVVPAEKAPKMMHLLDLERLAARQHTRAKFLAIAAELDGINNTSQED
jgi:hypothetical protein